LKICGVPDFCLVAGRWLGHVWIFSTDDETWQLGGLGWRLEQPFGELELWGDQRNLEPYLMGALVEWPALERNRLWGRPGELVLTMGNQLVLDMRNQLKWFLARRGGSMRWTNARRRVVYRCRR
jgi:hypothetical protein